MLFWVVKIRRRQQVIIKGIRYTRTLSCVSYTKKAINQRFFTFSVWRSRFEMYIGNARLCVCVSVCLSVPRRIPTLLHGPGCNLGEWQGPLVVHYLADLQSVYEFRCYDNLSRTRNVSECLYSLYMPG